MLISPGRIGRIGQPTGPMGRVSRLQSLLTALYGNGEQGAFYVPKPQVLGQQVLFQDAAGTTPVTADGDPVGRMLDLSGNDNHAMQEVSGSRPVYRTDGTRHWLEGDGVDDRLQAGSMVTKAGMYLAAAFCAFGEVSGGAFVRSTFGCYSDSTDRFDLRVRYQPVEGNHIISAAARVAGGTLLSTSTDNNAHPTNVPVLVDAVFGGDGLVMGSTTDGQWQTKTSEGSLTGTSSAAIQLFGNPEISRRFYSGLIVGSLVSDTQQQVCRRYLANLAGVTLDD